MEEEESTTSLAFLSIDFGPLKQVISGHCDGWQQRLTGLLNQLAAAELAALQDYCEGNASALQRQPSSVEQLADSVTLLGRLREERGALEARSAPLRCAYITSHHITLHHITSHHITSHHITSHYITVQFQQRAFRKDRSLLLKEPAGIECGMPGCKTAGTG